MRKVLLLTALAILGLSALVTVLVTLAEIPVLGPLVPPLFWGQVVIVGIITPLSSEFRRVVRLSLIVASEFVLVALCVANYDSPVEFAEKFATPFRQAVERALTSQFSLTNEASLACLFVIGLIASVIFVFCYDTVKTDRRLAALNEQPH